MRCYAPFGTIFTIKIHEKSEACNVIESKAPPWVFITFFKLYKWYQMILLRLLFWKLLIFPKVSIKDFFSNQWICSHLLKKSLMKNFIFCPINYILCHSSCCLFIFEYKNIFISSLDNKKLSSKQTIFIFRNFGKVKLLNSEWELELRW